MKPVQCRMARAALSWGVRDLAHKAGVSTQTVTRLERGDQLRPQTIQTIRQVFESAGIEFIPEDRKGSGVRLAKPSAE